MKRLIIICLLLFSSTQSYSLDTELAFSLATKAFVFCSQNQGMWLVLLGCAGWINQYFANSGFDRDLTDIKLKIDLNAQGITDHRRETAEQAALIREDIAEIKNVVDLLDNKVDERFDNQDIEVQKIAAGIDDLNNRLSSIEKHMSHLVTVGSALRVHNSSSFAKKNDNDSSNAKGSFMSYVFGGQ